MSLSLGLLITALSATLAGQPASKPTLDEALLTAMTRGCLTEIMGMRARAEAAGLGPSSFGIRQIDRLPNKQLEDALKQGGKGQFSQLESEQGPVYIANITGLEQPVCSVVVENFDASQHMAAFHRAFVASAPWTQVHVSADAAVYEWTAPNRPKLSVMMQAEWMGLVAQGQTVAPQKNASGLQLTITTSLN